MWLLYFLDQVSLNKKKELSLCDVNVPFKSIYMWETLYYLHEQTGWFTVCANGKQIQQW